MKLFGRAFYYNSNTYLYQVDILSYLFSQVYHDVDFGSTW